MHANNRIKTLNARLLTEPNWTFKAGYLAALISVAGAFAAYLILTKVFAFVLWFIPVFAKAMIDTVLTSHQRACQYRVGNEGYGLYSHNGVRIDNDEEE